MRETSSWLSGLGPKGGHLAKKGQGEGHSWPH